MTEQYEPHPPVAHTPSEHAHALHDHDDWFRHSPEEPTHQAAHGDFNPYLVMGSLAATILVVIVVVGLTLGWFKRLAMEKRQVVQEANTQYDIGFRGKLDAWQTQLHSEPTWVNERTNTIRITIDQAIEAVVKDYATR